MAREYEEGQGAGGNNHEARVTLPGVVMVDVSDHRRRQHGTRGSFKGEERQDLKIYINVPLPTTKNNYFRFIMKICF